MKLDRALLMKLALGASGLAFASGACEREGAPAKPPPADEQPVRAADKDPAPTPTAPEKKEEEATPTASSDPEPEPETTAPGTRVTRDPPPPRPRPVKHDPADPCPPCGLG
jgi:hypothetical protein